MLAAVHPMGAESPVHPDALVPHLVSGRWQSLGQDVHSIIAALIHDPLILARFTRVDRTCAQAVAAVQDQLWSRLAARRCTWIDGSCVQDSDLAMDYTLEARRVDAPLDFCRQRQRYLFAYRELLLEQPTPRWLHCAFDVAEWTLAWSMVALWMALMTWEQQHTDRVSLVSFGPLFALITYLAAALCVGLYKLPRLSPMARSMRRRIVPFQSSIATMIAQLHANRRLQCVPTLMLERAILIFLCGSVTIVTIALRVCGYTEWRWSYVFLSLFVAFGLSVPAILCVELPADAHCFGVHWLWFGVWFGGWIKRAHVDSMRRRNSDAVGVACADPRVLCVCVVRCSQATAAGRCSPSCLHPSWTIKRTPLLRTPTSLLKIPRACTICASCCG